MQKTCLLTTVALGLLIACGCGKEKKESANSTRSTPARAVPEKTTATKSAFQLNVDNARLRLPKGISKFWRDFNTELVPIERVDETLARARKFEELDQHKAYYYQIIPFVKVKAAMALCAAGKQEQAFSLLEEVREKGYLPSNYMRNSAFDSIREDEKFIALKEFSKAESNADAVGPYVVVKKPFFNLSDLLNIETTPTVPAAESLKHKVTVVLTGPALAKGLGGSDADLLSKIKDNTDATVIAITGKDPKDKTPGVNYCVAKAEPDALLIDKTRMLWIANRQGEVVYNLRLDAYYVSDEPVNVIEFLSPH